MQLIWYPCMKSSTKQTGDNLAGTPSPSDLLNALKALANLRDDSASFEWFARLWPVFAALDGDDLPDNYHGFVYGAPHNRMPPSLPKRFFLMWQQREALREIWRGDSDKVTQVLLPSLDEIYADPDPEGLWPPQLRVDWQRGEFVYVPRSRFQEAVCKLLRSSALAKVCANTDCPAPYFIAGRTTQQYCSEKCSGVLQRAHKLRWWKEHGKEWRSSKRSRGKRGRG
jgi:hypothetical protein